MGAPQCHALYTSLLCAPSSIALTTIQSRVHTVPRAGQAHDESPAQWSEHNPL